MRNKPVINNAFYDDLGERWYNDDTHAVALLRRESLVKLKYIEGLFAKLSIKQAHILDVGCGAGFISNPLAAQGFSVTGVDFSQSSLQTAKEYAPKNKDIRFIHEDAFKLASFSERYDVILLLDFLEHIEEPAKIFSVTQTLLNPGGIVVFHTFNRTFLAWLLAVKGLAIITRDCPDHVHVPHLFIKPEELRQMATAAGITVMDIAGLRPVFNWSLVKSGMRRRLLNGVRFTTTPSLQVGYIGYGVK